MMATVRQPFTTQSRRFSAGDEVSPYENLFPHTFDSLQNAGYIETLPVKISHERQKTRLRKRAS